MDGLTETGVVPDAPLGRLCLDQMRKAFTDAPADPTSSGVAALDLGGRGGVARLYGFVRLVFAAPVVRRMPSAY